MTLREVLEELVKSGFIPDNAGIKEEVESKIEKLSKSNDDVKEQILWIADYIRGNRR